MGGNHKKHKKVAKIGPNAEIGHLATENGLEDLLIKTSKCRDNRKIFKQQCLHRFCENTTRA